MSSDFKLENELCRINELSYEEEAEHDGENKSGKSDERMISIAAARNGARIKSASGEKEKSFLSART